MSARDRALSKTFTVRLTLDEYEDMAELGEVVGLSSSEVARAGIRLALLVGAQTKEDLTHEERLLEKVKAIAAQQGKDWREIDLKAGAYA